MLRGVGIGAVVRRVAPADTVRVILSHVVPAADLSHYRAIVERLVERRPALAPAQLAAFVLESQPIAGARSALSFDDGLVSSYEVAQRVLNPLGVKAMFFVPTAVLELRDDAAMHDFYRRRVYRSPLRALPPEYYRSMTADHLRELHRQGHAIFPHTHTHAALGTLRTEADLRREIEEPRARIEDLVQASAAAFAFPFGTGEVVAASAYDRIRSAYDLCFTGLGGLNSARTDPYFLHRDCVQPDFTLRHAEAVCAGNLDPVYRVKMRRLKGRMRRAARR